MIQFNQYITEIRFPSEKEYYEDEDFQEFEDHIKKKCKSWFSVAGKDLLVRGMGNLIKPFFYEKQVRKDRKSVAMKPAIQKKFDKAFVKNFGIKARSSCVFATGLGSYASSMFGTTYFIFPEGKFNFIWSPYNKDLNFFKSQQKYINFKTQEEFNAFVAADFVKNKNLKKALKSGHEIMIDCKSYCGITSYNYSRFLI